MPARGPFLKMLKKHVCNARSSVGSVLARTMTTKKIGRFVAWWVFIPKKMH
jgi:hypothetical protein